MSGPGSRPRIRIADVLGVLALFVMLFGLLALDWGLA